MKKIVLSVLSAAFLFSATYAQDTTKIAKKGYEFTTVKENKCTSVKDQYKSGTCWSFSALAMVESELLRTGKGEYDLSEMYIVRKAYEEKAEKYIRFHGHMNFGGGGAAHDIPNMIKKYGIVPEEAYKGLEYGESKHIHAELDKAIESFAKSVAESKKPSSAWKKVLNGILDAYLGPVPTEFTYKGKKYTPMTFAESLGLNWDDYVEVTSFTHHPFFTKFILEVPDNWEFEQVYNVPLDDMMKIIDESLNAGYNITWAADVSEKGFSWRNGVAIVPDEDKPEAEGTERERWEKLSATEKAAQLYKFDAPVKERTITPEIRQEAFDNFETTDDHGMEIVGIAKDQNNAKYYIVKNSWGTEHVKKGFFYASEAFVRYKTMDVLVNKNAINKDLRKKMGL